MRECFRFAHVLVLVCLPLQAYCSLGGIGVALLENKAIHADHPQAIPGLAGVLKKKLREVQGASVSEPTKVAQENSSAPSSKLPSFMEAVAALRNQAWPKSVVAAVVVLTVIVLIGLMSMLNGISRRPATSVHWSSVGSHGQLLSASTQGPRFVPGSAQVLDGRPGSSPFSLYDAKSNATAHFGSGHIPVSSAHSIESESTARLSYPYVNQKRAASASSVASRISECESSGSGGSDALCLALVVQKQEGVSIRFNGAVSAGRQESAFDVTTAGRTIMRILCSEFGLDSGILVESMMRAPIAFLNTSKAWSSEESSTDRRVLICRSLPASAATSGTEPFAVVMPDPNPLQKQCFQVCRGFGGHLLASVRLQENAIRVTSGEGLLMASVDAHITATSLENMSLHIQPNVDASLVVCILLAATKLM